MSKNGYKSNIIGKKYAYRTNNIKTESTQFHPQLNSSDDDLDIFSPISNQEHTGRIIHQSTEHSYDDMGNRVVTTKTVRELDSVDDKNKNFNQSKKSYTSKNRQSSKLDKPSVKHRKVSKYTNSKNEVEKQRALYSSPDFQSGSPYDSPLCLNDLKNPDDFYEEEYNQKYLYEKRDINGKNVTMYAKNERYDYGNTNRNNNIYTNNREDSPEIEIISPVGYMVNYSSGSEFEDNQMKSFDNYKTSGINDDNRNNFNRYPRNRNLNYELEDPEGFDYLRNNERIEKNKIFPKDIQNGQFLNRSEYRKKIGDESYQSDRRDFQSPDRNINGDKRFRNVTVGMIDSKGPTNEDRKVTKIMTSKVVNTGGNKLYEENVKKTKVYKNRLPKNKNDLSQVEAAKIIQAWWRRRYAGEEEVYDITVKKAIKLQSFIRGFLVRKKVLRYITLAIYYQSFCDKLQDVLCNHVKKELFNALKNNYFYDKNNEPKIRNSLNRPINNKRNITNNKNVTKREVVITQTKRTTQHNITQNKNYNILKAPTATNPRINRYLQNAKRSFIQSPMSYPSPITYTNQNQLDYRSPEVYQTRQTDVTIYHISPDIYNRNLNSNYSKNHNRSYNIIEKDRKIAKYTNDNRSAYSNYTSVENIDNKERNISPTFGALNQNKTTTRKALTTNHSHSDLNNSKKIYKNDSNNNIESIITRTKKIKKIITSNKKSKIPIQKTTTTKRKNIVKNTKMNKGPRQNEIISGGTLSIIKLPNRHINNSESENVFTRIKEKRIEKYENYGTEKRESRFKEPNMIDNQLSINIVKIPSEKKEKKIREEYVRYIEKPVEIIKEKEKIVLQKEAKPETAEEGNDTQLFDMKICKRVGLSIEASTETKEIIQNEIKEIEIFKKREREKNKQINKYKKDIEMQKLKNKLDKLKGAMRIADYWRGRVLNKKFKQFRNNSAQYPRYENIIDKTNQIRIVQEKPELIDMEVQHEPEDNYIDEDKLVIEIKGVKPNVIESVTQYEKPESKITQSSPFTIIGEPNKEVVVKVETAEAECNTFNEMVDEGVNAIVKEEPKPKKIEVQIRTVKRSLVKMEIPLLKKLWFRKAFRTFRDNCKRPEYHKVIGREILRMALLRWRFIKGYGPDRYGNAYDRDGNLLYKTKPKVADFEVQQEFIVEKEDQSTQYIPYENIISTLKQIQIGATYKKKKEPEKVDQKVGSDIRLAEMIQRGESISFKYKMKEKSENKIAKNQRLEINKTQKEVREQGTEMAMTENKISKLEKLNISGVDYKLRNQKNLRQKELLIQMIYKKMMGDKLALSDALHQWLRQTLLMLQIEQFDLDKKKRRFASISKNDRFALMEEIKKLEIGTQIDKTENKIETMNNINVIRIKKTKDSEASVNIPSHFDMEKMRTKNENKIIYKSSKKPVVLESHKENEMNIYSQDYIFNEEVKKGIHHPITEESKKRITEILIKYFQSRGDPLSVLRKYFTIWNRNANYLACLENAKIITDFCRRNLYKTINYRKWKKICEKLILREKVKIIKLSRVEDDSKKRKIFDLIRLTRINSVLAKRRYLHYILLCWLAYTRNMNRKRKHVKTLYENMLNTYMNMADDVFGNNQKENPSVQDALFEAVESDKFQTKDLHDVPLAEKYYQDKKEIKKVTTNITIINNADKDNEPKEYFTYKAFISKRPLPISASSGNIKEKTIKQKVIKVEPGERLQSKGRGRKYRTKVEREILNKFYDDKKIGFDKRKKIEKEEEKDENEVNEGNLEEKFGGKFNGSNYTANNFEGNKSISIRITSNKIGNNLGNSYNYSMNVNDKDINNINKKEMSYRKRRALFGTRYNNKKEDEKEMEDEK